MSSPQSSLARRVFEENRKPIVWLAAGLVINVLVYAFGVYPLSQRVANVSERNDTAARALAAARQENQQASGALTGKDQAVTKLDKFYTEVLPRDLASARALTHVRLAQLARMHNLRYERAQSEPVLTKDSKLTQLKVQMNLGGSYGGVRGFLHSLETAPQFVVIDNVVLGESDGDSLQLTLTLSTYYRSAL
jgi:type II secretion system (T2SS) protein M